MDENEKYPHSFCFQPNTYTRTKVFLKEFAKALSLADKIILADIYAAREQNTIGCARLQRQALPAPRARHFLIMYRKLCLFRRRLLRCSCNWKQGQRRRSQCMKNYKMPIAISGTHCNIFCFLRILNLRTQRG